MKRFMSTVDEAPQYQYTVERPVCNPDLPTYKHDPSARDFLNYKDMV